MIIELRKIKFCQLIYTFLRVNPPGRDMEKKSRPLYHIHFTVIHTNSRHKLSYFLHAILCPERTTPPKTIIDRSFPHCLPRRIFLHKHCDVTTVGLWCHANARFWCCDAIFFDCSCTRTLSQSWYSHYNDITMGTIASQITSLSSVYWTFYSGADQRKYQSSASLAFVWGIHRGPVNPRTNGQ